MSAYRLWIPRSLLSSGLTLVVYASADEADLVTLTYLSGEERAT